MNVNTIHPSTDLNAVDYDLNRHNWPAYWLSIAKEKFPQIESLETVHEFLSPSEILTLGRYCQSACGSEEFCDRVDRYFLDIVDTNTELKEWMIQRYFTIRIVIPNQAKKGRLLPFHQGIWVGNGIGMRTIWTPFTKVFSSNSMHICSYKDSMKLTGDIYENQWEYATIQEHCLEKAEPITMDPGQALLFQQFHIHGNVNNETNITRWSMDGRILPKGGHYHRKLPGGYFRFLGERESNVSLDRNKTWISYAGWNTSFSAGIPLPMQRNVINNYCENAGIEINDYLFENEFCDWLPSLKEFIIAYNVDGIILCSVYSLPDSLPRRRELLELAIKKNVEIHFANELTAVRTMADIAHIERIFEYVNENPDPNKTLNFNL